MNCNSNTAPLIDSISQDCENICNPKPINIICRQIIIPTGQDILAVQGDINSSFREFFIPIETEQGFELADANFVIEILNSENFYYEVSVDDNKTVQGNYIKLKWQLSEQDTSVAGDLKVAIKATKSNFKWETYYAIFKIQQNLEKQ